MQIISIMDEYLELFAKLDAEGLSVVQFEDLLGEIRRRGDRPREALLLLLRGDEEQAMELGRTVGADETLVAGLAKWVDWDPAWHMLFTIAGTSSAAWQRVEAAIRHWSDSAGSRISLTERSERTGPQLQSTQRRRNRCNRWEPALRQSRSSRAARNRRVQNLGSGHRRRQPLGQSPNSESRRRGWRHGRRQLGGRTTPVVATAAAPRRLR